MGMPNELPNTCSCGEPRAHIIARRSTADGKHVLLWCDGSLTWALGYAIRGSAQPRSPEQSRRALAAGWMVMGDVEVYDADELPALVMASRWAAERGAGREVMLAKLGERKGLTPAWSTIETDRDGNVLARAWRLPRLMFPGMVVWDESRGSHGRGRYQILTEDRGALFDTGVAFHSLRELQAHLQRESRGAEHAAEARR